MTWLYALIGGLIVGGSTTFGIMAKLQNNKPPPTEQVAQAQQEVAKQLTSTDILAVPCSAEYLATHSDALCREMFCRMQTRGSTGTGASQEECAAISNLLNSLEIIKTCKQYTDDGERDDCIRIFEKRK